MASSIFNENNMSPSFIPSIQPSAIPSSSPIPSLNPSTSSDDGTTLTLYSGIGIILSFFLAYFILKLFDRFCRTDVSEEYLALMIARLEGSNNNDEEGKRTIFAKMTQEERSLVLEKVLLRKVRGEKCTYEYTQIKLHVHMSYFPWLHYYLLYFMGPPIISFSFKSPLLMKFWSKFWSKENNQRIFLYWLRLMVVIIKIQVELRK